MSYRCTQVNPFSSGSPSAAPSGTLPPKWHGPAGRPSPLTRFGVEPLYGAKRIRRGRVFRATGADFGDELVGALRKVAVPDDFPTYGDIFTDAGKARMKTLLEEVKRTLGDGYTVKDKREQNQMLYKLLKYEKMAIFLILLFVVVIISFNIFSSLSMLIIAKRGDAMTLRSMGAEKSLINNIFLKEGLLVSALGIISGIVLGLLVCYLQQKFSLVKMPGNFVIDAYPVVVQWSDVALTALGVGLIGYAVSLLAKSQRL